MGFGREGAPRPHPRNDTRCPQPQPNSPCPQKKRSGVTSRTQEAPLTLYLGVSARMYSSAKCSLFCVHHPAEKGALYPPPILPRTPLSCVPYVVDVTPVAWLSEERDEASITATVDISTKLKLFATKIIALTFCWGRGASPLPPFDVLFLSPAVPLSVFLFVARSVQLSAMIDTVIQSTNVLAAAIGGT